jgi:pimeloyl-ACP methyl ester carboxylesterase
MARRTCTSFVALVLAVGTLVGAAPAFLTPAAAHTTPTTTTPTTTTPASTTPADALPGIGANGLTRWKACGKRLQCAVLQVPVDYAQPDGAKVGIAVARSPATDPSRRLGSLVINFGGPGDAGTSELPGFVSSFPAAVRAHYDLVSFDPRGTGHSRPIDCIDDQTADVLNAVDPTPNRDADLRSFYDGTHDPVDFIARCVARNGAWLAQVGSRNVARDLERLRIALGDDQLTYLGWSYGTVIGAVYAQMFPDRVGRFVLDSPVDLSSTAVEELDADSVGFEHALDAFLADCAAHSKCDFYSGGDPTAALTALQTRFEQGLTLPTETITGKPSSRRAGVSAFYTAVIAALYDKLYGWKELALALKAAEHGDGSLLLQQADDYNGRHANGTYDNSSEAIGIILCDDRFDSVPSFADYVADYHADVAAYPLLGGYLGSTVLGCDPRLPRPPESEQLGDVRAAGTKPILIVGTTEDPATPYAGARDLVNRLAGSRLLTFESTEHTAYLRTSCIDDAVDAYLLHGKLPPAGKTCAGGAA